MEYANLTQALESYVTWANEKGFVARQVANPDDNVRCYALTTPHFFVVVVATRNDDPHIQGWLSITGGAARGLPDTYDIYRRIAVETSALARVSNEGTVTASCYWSMMCAAIDPNPAVGTNYIYQMISFIGITAREFGTELVNGYGGRLIDGRGDDAEHLAN
jgi:hypothetical protein